MNYFEKIPVTTQSITFLANEQTIDTTGLEATIFAKRGDVFLKTVEDIDNSEAFVIKEGTYFTLCGRFILASADAEVRILYCKIM